jgi:hypothetical protein
MKKVVKVFLGIACIFTSNGIMLAVDYVPEEGISVPQEQAIPLGCPIPQGCPGQPGCPECPES